MHESAGESLAERIDLVRKVFHPGLGVAVLG